VGGSSLSSTAASSISLAAKNGEIPALFAASVNVKPLSLVGHTSVFNVASVTRDKLSQWIAVVGIVAADRRVEREDVWPFALVDGSVRPLPP
jgi:hypothetical protein